MRCSRPRTRPTSSSLPRGPRSRTTIVNAEPSPVWLLLGARHGDNRQLLAVAAALGLPFRAVQLRFNALSSLPPVLLDSSRASWQADAPLAAPWPLLVLAAGRRSVPAARWVQRQSGGRARLVHLNRPRAPLGWFDLVITTPQYALPDGANVLHNLLPFVDQGNPGDEPASVPLAPDARRPWTTVLVGGTSRPYVQDAAAATRLAALVNAEAADGTAWVLDSPRTPPPVLAALRRTLTAPARFVHWRDPGNAYRALLAQADRFIVTADSASMLAEALASGRPVTPFTLPARPDLRFRVAAAWRQAALQHPWSLAGRGFAAAAAAGLVSLRDVGWLQRAWRDAGFFATPGAAAGHALHERAATLARIRQLLPD